MTTDFRILGPLEVVENGTAIDVGGQKQRALLAMLLLHANEVVSIDRLIDALWEDDPPARAQKALQVYVSGLRKVVGPGRIETKAPGYLVRAAEEERDSARFEALVAQGAFRDALALWRGPALGDFAYARFAATEIARLEELRLSAVESRIEQDLAEGRHAEVAGELEGLVREHPLRERLRGQLMLALYRAGRQADALEAYKGGRRALSDELGLEPSRELRDLQQAILNQAPGLGLAVQGTAVAGQRAIFVGRERELREVLTALDEAFSGGGRLLLVAGEPGIGKTRLVEEALAAARSRGFRVLTGRCWEAGGAPAYWPWVQALRTQVAETPPDALTERIGPYAVELAQLVPEVHTLFPDLPEAPQLEPESARFRLYEAVSSFLLDGSHERPLVVALDDVHAADEPSLMLLQFVARNLGRSRALVIAAYRDIDPMPSDLLTGSLAQLGREPLTSSISISGLELEGVAEVVEHLYGERPVPKLVAAIHGETGGNPLFVGEIVRLLAVEEMLGDADPGRFAIPQSVRTAISRRLQHLSEECNRLLIAASVFGIEFHIETLARTVDAAEDAVLDLLDEATAARIVQDVPGPRGRIRFAHGLIRDVAYESMSAPRRVRIHRAALEALEARRGRELDEYLGELAYHAVAGSEFEKALEYAARAGHRALALLANDDAAASFQMALDALELVAPDDGAIRCRVLIGLGEARARSGESSAAKRTFLEAAEVARKSSLSSELARAAFGYGGLKVWARAGDDEVLVPLLEEALSTLGESDLRLRAMLLARLGGALRDEHSRTRREACSLESVELARAAGDPAALAFALDGRAASIIAPDTVLECVEIATEMCAVAEALGDSERLIEGLDTRLAAEVILGDMAAVSADLEHAGQLSNQLGQPTQLWAVRGDEAMLALAMGRLDDAADLIRDALELGERAIPELAIPVYHVQRYTLCDFRGELDGVAADIARIAERHPTRPMFRCVLAHVLSRDGQLREAGALLSELSCDGCASLPFDQEWLYGMSLLAEVAASLGMEETGDTLYPLLLPWSNLNAVDLAEGMRGSVSRYLALLAEMLGRFGDAERHFEDALAMNDRMGAHPWLALTQEDHGRMLISRGEDVRGRALVEQALATYRELGMHGPFRRAEAFAAAGI